MRMDKAIKKYKIIGLLRKKKLIFLIHIKIIRKRLVMLVKIILKKCPRMQKVYKKI